MTPAKLLNNLEAAARRSSSGWDAAQVYRGPRMELCWLRASLTTDGRVTWMLGGQRIARADIAAQIHL